MMLNQLTEYLELPDRTHIELSSGLGFNESSESPGFAALAEFRLEDGLPVWRYEIGGIVIEKKIFMVHGQNTTLISYDLLEGDERVRVKLCPHVQFRPHENFVDKAPEDYTLRATRQGFEICTAAVIRRCVCSCMGATGVLAAATPKSTKCSFAPSSSAVMRLSASYAVSVGLKPKSAAMSR